jgi:cyclopropane fatty-acyl-phospholipid synthase-like methyltransferase
VARYYEASTRRFLAVGGSGRSLAIHRSLWADGIRTTEAAANHINTLMRDEAVARLGRPPDHVRDLGCGVGGSVLTLARDWPATRCLGITISRTQVELAEAEARARGLSDRCAFLRADFTTATEAPPADLAIAVESHVHAPGAGAFLDAARHHLRPGGVLLIVDDMLARPEAQLSARDRRRLESFRHGWRLGHVPDIAGLIAEAGGAGFTHEGTHDLTPLIRLTRLRDIALRGAGPLAARLGLGGVPVFANMIGGNALTESYRHGVMRYAMVTLRRDER